MLPTNQVHRAKQRAMISRRVMDCSCVTSNLSSLADAVDEMNRMQQLESARKEQEALSGKTDEMKLSKKHFRAG